MKYLDTIKFYGKKYAPELLLGTSIVAGIGATVTACFATTKVESVLSEYNEKIEVSEKAKSEGELCGVEYTEEDYFKDLKILKTQRTAKVAALYAIPAGLTVLSIATSLQSHKIMKTRNAALAASLTAVSAAFTEYSRRVKERFGEEVENEIRTNTKTVKDIVVDEKGKEVEQERKVSDEQSIMPYTFRFDTSNPKCCKSRAMAWQQIVFAQNWCNDLMKSRIPRHLFLNEALDSIGIEKCAAGQIVGWTYNGRGNHVNGNGQNADNHVDFGVNINDKQVKDFISGKTDFIDLTFNVDGPIYNLLDKE